MHLHMHCPQSCRCRCKTHTSLAEEEGRDACICACTAPSQTLNPLNLKPLTLTCVKAQVCDVHNTVFFHPW